MGFLSKLFGGAIDHTIVKDVDKVELMRQLARIRLRSDPMATTFGLEEMIDSLSDIELWGTPEGTIVAIVETWCLLKKMGAAENEAFAKIEKHRSEVAQSNRLPTPLTLASYVRYRVRLEYSDGPPISEAFFDTAIELASKAFN